MSSTPPTKPVEYDKTSLYTIGAEDGTKEEALKPLYSADRESRNLHIPRDYASGVLRATSPDGFSEMSMDDRYSLPIPRRGSGTGSFASPATPAVGWKAKALASWARNKGLAYVLLAQIFGTLMNVTARLLELEGNDGKGFHPFQILFARMGLTVILASLYMWWKGTPHFPLGVPGVRGLLVARGLTGFFGVFVPANTTNAAVPDRFNMDHVSPENRLLAVGIATLGVFGAAGAYTTLRWIGKRAHPLISVNYFAAWCTIVSAVMMFVLKDVGLLLPGNLFEWSLLFFIGLSGFIFQLLLSAGLQAEKSSRATNMMYTQMLFALGFDKVIFGTTPAPLSIIGSSLILGSAIYVAVHRESAKVAETVDRDAIAIGIREEEMGLVNESEMDERVDSGDEEGDARRY